MKLITPIILVYIVIQSPGGANTALWVGRVLELDFKKKGRGGAGLN